MPKGKGPKHTACRRGTKVIIKTRDGQVIIDKFIERKNGTIYLEKFGHITKANMTSFAVYKPRNH